MEKPKLDVSKWREYYDKLVHNQSPEVAKEFIETLLAFTVASTVSLEVNATKFINKEDQTVEDIIRVSELRAAIERKTDFMSKTLGINLGDLKVTERSA